MENRKLIILFSLFLSLTFSSQVFAYEIGTHAHLTDEIVNFYNTNFPENKISNELTSYLIDGSRREDDAPRWMNHYYDPVNNRGLSYDPAIDPAVNLGTWEESKNWANDEDNQNKLTYKVPATVASILTAFEQKKLSDISSETDFTWKKAIGYWIKGDKEKAMFALGHILHLIEDSSVPDHTRNDPHPNDSPYEKWTSKFIMDNPDGDLAGRLFGKKPFILDNLDSYFNGLATYSNNNFYSKDTIGIQSGYKLPEPIDYEKIEENLFALNNDKQGNIYKLSVQPAESSALSGTIGEIIIDDNKVMLGYWNLLSAKSVQYGAGVIDLFFKEVEKAKNDPSFVKEESKSMLAQVKETLGNFLNQLLRKEADTSGLALVAEIPLRKEEEGGKEENGDRGQGVGGTNGVEGTRSPVVSADNQDEDAAEQVAERKQQIINSSVGSGQAVTNFNAAAPSAPAVVSAGVGGVGQGEATVAQCKYGAGGTPTHQKLIINEVAWMGGTVSANDEWLELKNISGSELNIFGWQILDKSEQIKVTFLNGTKLATDGMLLLERTDDNSVPSVVADLIYTGALSNTDEGLRLFDKNCALVDEVTASPDWPAGDSVARKTMERSSDLSWHTSSVVMGTPKAENSNRQQTTNNNQTTNNDDQPQTTDNGQTAADHLVISEVQITGGTGQTANDFIELYNPTGTAVNLNGYRLVKRTKTGTSDTSIKSWTSDAFVPAKGFYLWANSNYTGIGVTPDATTTASIAADNGVALRQGAEDIGTIIDSVAWGEAQNGFIESAVFQTNPGVNQSLERKAFSNSCVSAQNTGEFFGNGCDTGSNQNDFELRSTSNPQNSKSLPEPRPSPAQAQNLNVSFSSAAMELILNWDESRDYNGATSSVKYLISHGTSTADNLVNIAELTAATSYQFKIKDVGITHYLGIIAKDADGLPATTTKSNIAVGTPLSNFAFYKDSRSTTSKKYLLEFNYSGYPFVEDIYQDGAQDTWKILVFYLNREASDEIELNIGNNWQPENIGSVLEVKYPNCAGGNTSRYSLILPDNETRCGIGGGIENSALHWNNLEDFHLLLELATTSDEVTFTENDFVTVGLYSFYQSGGGDQKFKLVGLDRTNYSFATATPSHQLPEAPDGLEMEFFESTSLLRVFWSGSQDSDTLDNLITYEINYGTSTLSDSGWEPISASFDADEELWFGDISVEPANNYNIAIRAKDDFGSVSDAVEDSFEVPDIPIPYDLSNIEWGYLSDSFEIDVRFNMNSYPFMTADVPSVLVFFLNQSPPPSYSFSNFSDPYNVGGANQVLKLKYPSCAYSSGYDLFGGLVFHNQTSCPASGSGLKTDASHSNLSGGETSFTMNVAGVLNNGGSEAHTFSSNDYLTIGFYELSGSIFQEAVTYNKKIYFQP